MREFRVILMWSHVDITYWAYRIGRRLLGLTLVSQFSKKVKEPRKRYRTLDDTYSKRHGPENSQVFSFVLGQDKVRFLPGHSSIVGSRFLFTFCLRIALAAALLGDADTPDETAGIHETRCKTGLSLRQGRLRRAAHSPERHFGTVLT